MQPDTVYLIEAIILVNLHHVQGLKLCLPEGFSYAKKFAFFDKFLLTLGQKC